MLTSWATGIRWASSATRSWGMWLSGPPQPSAVMDLADRYGLQFGQPDWLPDLIARYDLTPLPEETS